MTGPADHRPYQRVDAESWQNRALVSAVRFSPLTSSTMAVGDPSATRTVYLTTVLLVLLGLALAALAWWLVRRTRPEPELFAPLEQMESRAWRKLNDDERRESLDAVRPLGARVATVDAAADDHSRDHGRDHDVVLDDDLDDDDPTPAPDGAERPERDDDSALDEADGGSVDGSPDASDDEDPIGARSARSA